MRVTAGECVSYLRNHLANGTHLLSPALVASMIPSGLLPFVFPHFMMHALLCLLRDRSVVPEALDLVAKMLLVDLLLLLGLCAVASCDLFDFLRELIRAVVDAVLKLESPRVRTLQRLYREITCLVRQPLV